MLNKLSKIFSKIDSNNFSTFYRDLSCLSLAISASNSTASDLVEAVYVIAFAKKPSKHFTFSKNIDKLASVKQSLNLVQEYLAFKKASKFLNQETVSELISKTALNKPNFALFETFVKNSGNIPEFSKNANRVNSGAFGLIVDVYGKWHLTHPITGNLSSLYLTQAGLNLVPEVRPYKITSSYEVVARDLSELSEEEISKIKDYIKDNIEVFINDEADFYSLKGDVESVFGLDFGSLEDSDYAKLVQDATGYTEDSYNEKLLEKENAKKQEERVNNIKEDIHWLEQAVEEGKEELYLGSTKEQFIDKTFDIIFDLEKQLEPKANEFIKIYTIGRGDLKDWDPYNESQGMKEIEQVSLTKSKDSKQNYDIENFSAKELARTLSDMKEIAPEKYKEIMANLSSKLTGKDQKAFDFLLTLEKANFNFMDAVRLDGEFSTHASYQDLLKDKVLPILLEDPAYTEALN